MNPLDDTTAGQLRSALLDVSRTIDADGSLAARATVGGRTRLRRRRTATAGAVIVSAAALVGAIVLSPSGLDALRAHRERPQPAEHTQAPTPRASYEQLAQRPTTGDLAADPTMTDRLVAATNDDLLGTELRDLVGEQGSLLSPPHVVWAGNTPAGQAAMAVVKARIKGLMAPTADAADGDRWVALFFGQSFAESDTKGLHVVRTSVYLGDEESAWFVDPEDETGVVVVDLGGRYVWNSGFRYAADGTLSTQDHPIRFKDGAAFVPLPPGLDFNQFQIRRDGRVILGGSDLGTRLNSPDEQIDWLEQRNGTARIGGLGQAAKDSFAVGTALRRSWAEALPPGVDRLRQNRWLAAGRLNDDTDVLVFTETLSENRPHAFLALIDGGRAHLVHAGEIADGGTNPDSGEGPPDPPIMGRLPGGAGTVVVQFGATLRYRSADGAWSAAVKDAVFVPAEATELNVRNDSGQETYPLR
jgi:hypothetical protein